MTCTHISDPMGPNFGENGLWRSALAPLSMDIHRTNETLHPFINHYHRHIPFGTIIKSFNRHATRAATNSLLCCDSLSHLLFSLRGAPTDSPHLLSEGSLHQDEKTHSGSGEHRRTDEDDLSHSERQQCAI